MSELAAIRAKILATETDLALAQIAGEDPRSLEYECCKYGPPSRTLKAYVLQKIIQYQQVMEEHLRAMSIEIYTERADQVSGVCVRCVYGACVRCVCGVCI